MHSQILFYCFSTLLRYRNIHQAGDESHLPCFTGHQGDRVWVLAQVRWAGWGICSWGVVDGACLTAQPMSRYERWNDLTCPT